LQDKSFLEKKLSLLSGSDNQETKKPSPALALIRTDTASQGTLPSIRTFQGRLLEVKNTTLSSEVTGLVYELPVEEGNFVKAGTLIAQIDDTWIKFTHETAAREIELRKTILEYEKSEMQRLSQLVESRAVSQSEYLLQVNKADQINTNLEIARVVWEESGEKLKRTKIVAPFDGHIVKKMTEAGSLLSPGNPIVQIISSGDIDAVVPVTQTVIDRVALGDQLAVDIHDLNLKVNGKVHLIVPYAPSVGPRMFPVHIRLPNDTGRLKSGMAVDALIPESEPKQGIIVPVEAVLDRPDGRTIWVAIVQKAEGERQERVTVQPVPVKMLAHAVISCAVEPETKEGKDLLVDKSLVVVEGAERLTPGQFVKIKDIATKYLKDLPTGSGHTVIRAAEEGK
jgi:RND family efflux transporter MFP subunit